MEKLGQSIKKSIDDISVPKEKLDRAVNEAFASTRKRQIQKNQRVLMGIASLFMIGLVTLLFATVFLPLGERQSMSSNNDPIFMIDDERLQKVAEEGRFQELEKFIENEDVIFAIEEAYYDSGLVALTYKVKVNTDLLRNDQVIELDSMGVLIDDEPQFFFPKPFRFTQNQPVYEDVLIIENLKDAPDQLSIDVFIPEIRQNKIGVGEEVLSIVVEKDTEETVTDFYVTKELAEDQLIEVGPVQYTPSQVLLHTKLRVPKELSFGSKPSIGVYVIGKEENGRVQHSPRLLGYQAEPNYHDISYKYSSFKGDVQFSREHFADQFTVVPYVHASDEEWVIHTELKEGSTLSLTEYPMNVVAITDSDPHTIVTIQMDKENSYFPFHLITAYRSKSDQHYRPLYFEKLDNGFVEIVYPQIEHKTGTVLTVENFRIFEELATEVELN
ncbi:hypothetical protein JCM9140_1563 [Halalkalibacter wakoensis JCM 9140]|uniref:DUF4179 domain-containing protein n=1 Tax=Halalkalibacter wakoensis JCM 9140 TaxID=1236970 RepID=W4Q1H2_9BACI|nr:DUF4179 domain-containing protein [Halalkalibacter wakoensis]GAE25563.1 hypothetical protein JCM9140_1563 [Halalkalibacter wakoensis JCM 9140]